MRGIEKILYKKMHLATVFRKNIVVNGVKFLTSEQNPLQVGIHQAKKGVRLTPHLHQLSKKIEISVIQEILYVVQGKIRITIYTKKADVIEKKILTAGDSVLFLSEGHGVDFLEDSHVFEVKQGPHKNSIQTKIYLKNTHESSSK